MRVAIGTMTTWALLAVLLTLHTGTARALEPQSDYELLSDDLKQMQNDEFANPGMLTVEKGRTLFAKPGYNGKACASCHGKDGAK
ncbi:MAG: hypothetical protein P8090_04275, partial [Gammaproteobacteria bacterium]